MAQKLKRSMLERYRDWLLNDVIPGFQRRKDQESIRRSVEQLDGIEKKLAKFRYPREKKE